jgi:hypothetical protein
MIHIGAPQVSSPTLKNRPLRGGGDKYFGITKMQKNETLSKNHQNRLDHMM